MYFVPPEWSLQAARLDPKQAKAHRTKLLDINGQDRYLTIYPIGTFGDKPDFLKPKYRQVERITIADTNLVVPGYDEFFAPGGSVPTTPDAVVEMLEDLPSAFTKDYAYGLSLAKPYRPTFPKCPAA